MQKDIEMILIPLNVFSTYAYRVKISNFYFHFYYGKTWPQKFKSGWIRSAGHASNNQFNVSIDFKSS